MSKIEAEVTKTVKVEMKPVHAFCYFAGEERRIMIQYGEFHDGELARTLAMQQAPAEHANPILDAVEKAMMDAAAASFEAAKTMDYKDWDANQQYMMGLVNAGKDSEN